MLGGLGAYASILKVFIGLFPSAIHCMLKPTRSHPALFFSHSKNTSWSFLEALSNWSPGRTKVTFTLEAPWDTISTSAIAGRSTITKSLLDLYRWALMVLLQKSLGRTKSIQKCFLWLWKKDQKLSAMRCEVSWYVSVLASQKTLPPRYVYLHLLLWKLWEQLGTKPRDLRAFEHSCILHVFITSILWDTSTCQ